MGRMRGLLYSMLPVVAMMSLPANAGTIFSDTFDPQQPGWSFASPSPGIMGELNNNANVSNVSLSVVAANADPAAMLEFDLLMFRTLDGTRCCTDSLTLTINNNIAFTGTFTVGPADTTFFTNPFGASFTQIDSNIHRFSVPHALLEGVNTYNWSYTPLQPLFDEAWGLDNVAIEVETVPEPATILSFAIGLLGLRVIRKKR